MHAGVYPMLDLQQLAAHSIAAPRLSWADMALTVLAEVHSLYPGRESCKAYEGMAMVTPWGREGVVMPRGDVEAFRGWIVGRFSQEHGILTWRRGPEADLGPPP